MHFWHLAHLETRLRTADLGPLWAAFGLQLRALEIGGSSMRLAAPGRNADVSAPSQYAAKHRGDELVVSAQRLARHKT
jgi:hypothetical protein